MTTTADEKISKAKELMSEARCIKRRYMGT